MTMAAPRQSDADAIKRSYQATHLSLQDNGGPSQLKGAIPQHSSRHFYLNGDDEDDTADTKLNPIPYKLNRSTPDIDDSETRGEIADGTETQDEDDDELSTTSGRRHGALLQPEEADLVIFESPYMTQWTQKRHTTGGNPKPRNESDLPDWRMKERLRTVTAALVMCLNIGVDPPDVSKTNPCSKLICWMDPGSIEVSKALPAIGKNLQGQFETLSMKTRYKQYLDPIVEETKRFCTSLRRTAKDERVLFYYNGFGVPKPTPGGEIWVFNKAYTQYIPVTLYDLQAWLGNPCIFVWDASSAGNVVVNFQRLADRKAEEEAKANGGIRPTNSDDSSFPLRESIHLAACAPDEVLPMNPDLPADLFTCCLTSPIEISLRWFVLQNPLPSSLTVDMVMNIPGRLQDRRTPLGELNWIFTAITDTIAWTVLPRTIFRRLFRDDLMVAALLRNYLLAERIMRFYHCTPMSRPKLPLTHNHPLWNSWDLAVDQCLSQLPTLLAKEQAAQMASIPGNPPMNPHLANFEYRHSTFFSEQLMAFEVWLSQGGMSRKSNKRRGDPTKGFEADFENIDGQNEENEVDDREFRDPPDQLPIVLQVLLSQVHRLRALILLSQFLDLGPWAVNLALSIGIFPYVLKLLQSPAADLKPVLIYIWARILAVDQSCQNDLLRDEGFKYFATVLSPVVQGSGGPVGGANPSSYPIPNVSEHRAMCAFILSVFCQDFPAGQQACLQTDAMDSCFEHLDDDDFLLRQWSALCIGQLWDDSSEGKARGIAKDVHGKLACMLSDISPEVRAAVLYALGILLGGSGSSWDPTDPNSALPTHSLSSRHAQTRPHCLGSGHSIGLEESKQRSLEIGVAVGMLATKGDSSPLVRKELVIALSPLIREYQGFFVLAAYLYFDREERKLRFRDQLSSEDIRGVDPGMDPSSFEEAILTRVLSQLALEEGLDEVDIANVPAFSTLFVSLLDLSADSHPEVASMASTVVDYIVALMLDVLPLESRASPSITINRLVTPTSTLAQREDYFPYMPRSKMSAANDHLDDQGYTTTSALPSHPNGSSVRVHARSGTTPPVKPAHPKRVASLAQTVKTIATLGYSRPSSPDHGNVGMENTANADVTPPNNAYLPPRIPAPRLSSARYISPFKSVSTPDSVNGSPTSPSTPLHSASATPGANSSIALRSASAESLAQIARMQSKRNTRLSTPPSTASHVSTTPNNTTAKTSFREQTKSLESAASISPRIQSINTSTPSPDLKVADTLAAVISVDLQRFRERAAFANLAEGLITSHSSTAGHTPLPSPATLRNHGVLQSDSTIREVLPLKSKLFAWCSEYYTEPQMKCAEQDEPGSVKYNNQTWKRERNERLIIEAQAETERATEGPWNDQIASIQVGAPVSKMIMHPFENQLVTASEQDTVSIWDWSESKLLSRFNNGNPPRTNITSMVFANEDANSRLLVGSADGDVRIYADYDEPSWSSSKGPTLVSSMRALPDLVRSKKPSGLILDWQQITGSLLAGGDSRVIRVWDAHRELCICDIPTRVSSCVTCISSETDVGHIYICGFGDGTIGVYDRRIPPELSLVRLWEEHSNWIVNVCLQKRGNRELISASTDGIVKVWDIRGRNSLQSKDWTNELRGKLSSLTVHDNAPIYAISSYPKPQRFGLSPMRTLLCNIETMDLVQYNAPIVRHFAQSNSAAPLINQANNQGNHQQHNHNHHHYHHHQQQQGHQSSHNHPVILSQAIDIPSSHFMPSMTSLAFHPYYPILAFGGPDLLGNVSLMRLMQPQNQHHYIRSHSSSQLHSHNSHIGMSILDSEDQRHIPSFTNTDAASSKGKGLFGF